MRCGRCGGAFDAISRLSDSLPESGVVDPSGLLDDVSSGIAAAAAAESGVPPEYHFSAADLEKVFIEARDWPETSALLRDIERDPEPVVVVEPGRIEDITLEGEKIRIEDLEDDELTPLLLDDDAASTRIDYDLSGNREGVDYDLSESREGVDNDTTNRLRTLRFVPDSRYPDDESDADASASWPVDVDLSGDVEDEPEAGGAENAAPVAEPAPASPPQAAPSPAALDWPLPPPSRASAPSATGGTTAAQRWASAAREEPLDLDVLGDDTSHWSKDPRVWKIGTAVLTLLMLVQVTNHYRDRLARQPQIGPAIRAIYGGLGVPLATTWDLRSFEVRQWGPDDESVDDGQLNVRASLTNRAAFAQPLPLLRLEIEDRYGAAVAIRDFEPREYLENPARGDRMLAAGEAAEARLDVVAPGADAVGYRLNVCLRDAERNVRCSSTSG